MRIRVPNPADAAEGFSAAEELYKLIRKRANIDNVAR
jgi:hypothetical protein